MNISDVYTKYKIMPHLAMHMYRVSAVASLICDNFEKEFDKDSIITACLLHDMGNIIKFKLRLKIVTPQKNLEPQGLCYWEKVQKNYIQKYGPDEHKANFQISKELGVSDIILQLVDAYSFSGALETKKLSDYNVKISTYSDMRVTPYGIESLVNRIEDGVARNKVKMIDDHHTKFFEDRRKAWKIVEKQIFDHCTITPSDITDSTIKPVLESLRDFEI